MDGGDQFEKNSSFAYDNERHDINLKPPDTDKKSEEAELTYRNRSSEYVDTKKEIKDDLTMVYIIIAGCVFVILLAIVIVSIQQHYFTIQINDTSQQFVLPILKSRSRQRML